MDNQERAAVARQMDAATRLVEALQDYAQACRGTGDEVAVGSAVEYAGRLRETHEALSERMGYS